AQLVRREHPGVTDVEAEPAAVALEIAVRVGEHEAPVVLEDQHAGDIRGAGDERVDLCRRIEDLAAGSGSQSWRGVQGHRVEDLTSRRRLPVRSGGPTARPDRW